MAIKEHQYRGDSNHPKKLVTKNSSMVKWALPTSVMAIMGLFFLFFFFPLGIVCFIVAAIIVGFNVLRHEVPEEGFSDSNESLHGPSKKPKAN